VRFWIVALWWCTVTKDQFLQETLEFWQKRTKRVLTLEDAREIAENMNSFMDALISRPSDPVPAGSAEVQR